MAEAFKRWICARWGHRWYQDFSLGEQVEEGYFTTVDIWRCVRCGDEWYNAYSIEIGDGFLLQSKLLNCVALPPK